MNRVLVTGGAGTVGAAVVRRLLRDPAYAVRVSDQRPAPQWMREGCEVHQGDLRQLDEARKAMQGCSHVIHLAAIVSGSGDFERLPHTLTEVNNALTSSTVRAALDLVAERFVYVSSAMVFERATEFPTPESYLADTPIPQSAYGFSKLTGEIYVKAAHAEHGLPYTICRPFNAYGPGQLTGDEPGAAHVVPDLIEKCLALESGAPLPILGDGSQRRTLTHLDDVADGIVTAMSSDAGLHEDFNISAADELTIEQIARIIWSACDRPSADFALEHLSAPDGDVARRWPSVTKAEDLLRWRASIDPQDGIGKTVAWRRRVLATQG